MKPVERNILAGIVAVTVITAWVIISSLLVYADSKPYEPPCRTAGHMVVPC